MVDTWISSPKTGKPIIVGGPTYNTLKLSSVYGPKLKNAKSVSPPKSPKKGSYMSRLPASHTQGAGGAGGYSKGWKDAAPKRGKEREQLIENCGTGCFLRPKERKFPICPKCHGNSCTCSGDCRGLMAARIRGEQYKDKYPEVAGKAIAIAKEKGCAWAKKL